MRAFLCALLLAASLMAGCSDSTAGVELSAREALEVAQAEADDWSDDAVLVSVVGVERGSDFHIDEAALEAQAGPPGMDRAAPLRLPLVARSAGPNATGADEVQRALDDMADSRPGDGLAPMWVFTFSDGQGLLPVVVLHGEVLGAPSPPAPADIEPMEPGNASASSASISAASTPAPDCGYCMPLGNWSLDSDDAADAAADVDATFAELRGDSRAVGMYQLVASRNGTYWVASLAALDPSPRATQVALDAESGAQVPVALAFAPPVLSESGTVTGTVNALTSPASVRVDVREEGHTRAAFVLETTGLPVPMQQVAFEIVAPDGSTHSSSFTTDVLAPASATIELPAAPAGAYEVTVSLELGATQGYRLSWCTDGVGLGTDGNAACAAL